MKARSRARHGYIVILSIIILNLAGSVVLAQAAPQKSQAFQSTANNQQPAANNYCVSCHSANDPRLENPTAWRGGIALTGASPCPALQKMNEELYYTERLLLAIDRYQSTLPAYIGTTSLDNRLASAQQSYLRLLDTPVTSLDAFTAEAQAVRFKLGKVYRALQSLDETARQTRALIVGMVITLILIVSLIWGLYHTRHVSRKTNGRRRSTVIGAGVFLLLVFAFFALPLLRVPTEEVVTDAEAQALQTTLDIAQRAASKADRSQARAWMLGKIAAAWNTFDPAKAEAIFSEALAASVQEHANSVALWGEGAAAQEAATGDLAKLETAGLIADRLDSARSRTWELRLIADEWRGIDPERARQTLEVALEAEEGAQGIYRDLDYRGIAVSYAALNPQRARQIANQIEDPALRAWALREIEPDSANPDTNLSEDPTSAEAQTLSMLLQAQAGDLLAWQAAWDASVDIMDPFERARAQAEIVRGWSNSAPDRAVQAAQQIEIPLMRDRAMRFISSITGDASLVSQIKNPYDRVMALTALGQYAEAVALVGELKDTYPLVYLAQALAEVDPQKALDLVDDMQREVDKAGALRSIAAATRDPAIFERALDMALAARVRNDALAPALASLNLANAYAGIDPSLAQQALQQALEIAQKISNK